MIIDRGVPFRPDWENVITPVVDFVLTLPGVDPDKLAADGAELRRLPGAARGDRRAPPRGLHLRLRTVRPLRRERKPRSLGSWPSNSRTATRPSCGSSARIAAEESMARPTHGLGAPPQPPGPRPDGPARVFPNGARLLTQGPRRPASTCPTFVCSAEGDDLSADARHLFDALRCPKEYVQFTKRRRRRGSTARAAPAPSSTSRRSAGSTGCSVSDRKRL